jgi:hypothetical protein
MNPGVELTTLIVGASVGSLISVRLQTKDVRLRGLQFTTLNA